MSKCNKCGKEVSSVTHYKTQWLCDDCYKETKLNNILTRSKRIHAAEDLSGWDHGDMSDLFWYHLGEYVKDRNPEEHFPIMKSCLYWAFHDSHGLSSSFVHALKWAKVDYIEILNWSY